VANDLLGRAAYTRLKGIDPIRDREIVREYVAEQGSINSTECRELLGLGESATAKVDASRLLGEWSGPGGFLRKVGTRGPGVHYVLAVSAKEEN
jgi:ATP-dependent DNA helicase RecG